MLDRRKQYKTYSSHISMVDLMLNLVLGFVFLFVVAFMLISIPEQKAKIDTRAEMVITLTWNDEAKDDVDLWVQDPNEETVYFSRKERGLTHLDRDDLGHTKDRIVGPDGKPIECQINQEIATIRGFIPGEWIVNVHMYRKDLLTPPSSVTVKIEKLNPSVTTLVLKKYTMGVHWEEITVARFVISASGEMLQISDLPKSLVDKHIIQTYVEEMR